MTREFLKRSRASHSLSWGLWAQTARTATLDTGMLTGSGNGTQRTLASGYSIVVFIFYVFCNNTSLSEPLSVDD